jgi:hypothetical protein
MGCRDLLDLLGTCWITWTYVLERGTGRPSRNPLHEWDAPSGDDQPNASMLLDTRRISMDTGKSSIYERRSGNHILTAWC